MILHVIVTYTYLLPMLVMMMMFGNDMLCEPNECYE